MRASRPPASARVVRSLIPARIDRLPWTPFHTRLVAALGVAWVLDRGLLTALTQTIAWCVIFFLASSGAGAAYLTVSEIFPIEVRAKAIAVFFAIAERKPLESLARPLSLVPGTTAPFPLDQVAAPYGLNRSQED
jgi:hypothetical protein